MMRARVWVKDTAILDVVDHVIKIIIDNGHHQYEYKPEDITKIQIEEVYEPAQHP